MQLGLCVRFLVFVNVVQFLLDCARRCADESASGGGRRGRSSLFGASFFGVSSPVFEAPAVVAGFEDMAVVRQTVEKCRGHLSITKHIGPFTEA